MPRDHVTARHGIPCTSVERTLLDLGAVLSERRVAIAVDHALFNGLTTMGSLDFCLFLTARRGRRGCRPLRNVLKSRLDLVEVPNSPLESLVFEMLSRAGLRPKLQMEVFDGDGFFIARPDFVFPEERLVVEGHSRLWHSSESAIERDLRRHRRLVAAGYRVVYVTWYDVCGSTDPITRRIEMLLEGADGDETPPAFSGDVRKEW